MEKTLNESDVRSFNDLLVSGGELKPYSNNPLIRPVPEYEVANKAKEVLLINPNSNWVSQYGNWQVFNIFKNKEVIIDENGFPVQTSTGEFKTMYHRNAGWSANGAMDKPVGFWNTWGAKVFVGVVVELVLAFALVLKMVHKIIILTFLTKKKFI